MINIIVLGCIDLPTALMFAKIGLKIFPEAFANGI